MRGKNKAKYFFIHSVAQFQGNNKNWIDAMCRYQGEKKQNTEIINRQHVLLLLLFFLLLLLLFLVLLLLLLFFLAIVAVPQVVRVDAFVAVVVRDAAFVAVVVGVAAVVAVTDVVVDVVAVFFAQQIELLFNKKNHTDYNPIRKPEYNVTSIIPRPTKLESPGSSLYPHCQTVLSRANILQSPKAFL